MASEETGMMPGERMLAGVEQEYGARELSVEELMSLYGADKLDLTEEEVMDGFRVLAALYIDQEEKLKAEQGEDYLRPAFISLANGANPVVSELAKILAKRGYDIDPFQIATKGTVGDEIAESVEITKGLDKSDLKAMNHRRVIILDDMWHTGATAEFVKKYVIQQMGQSLIIVEEGGKQEVVELEPITEADVQFMFYLTKDPEATSQHKPPTLTARKSAQDRWTTGVGGNTFRDESGGRKYSVGRYAMAVFSKPRPESEE